MKIDVARARDLHMSPREILTLHRLCSGRTRMSVAIELELSPYTVDQYIKTLFKRFNAHTMAQLAAEACLRGVVTRDDIVV